MTQEVAALLAQHGLALVFLTVLVQQLGFPLPAVPVMVIAGSLAAAGGVALPAVVLLAFAACMAGDLAWYWAGRRFGERILRALCRLSLSPDSCVYQSELRFERWHGRVLVAAKFVPGLSLVAPPLAGALGLGLARFALFDGLGALLWIGAAVAVGYLFAHQVAGLLDALAAAGSMALAAVSGLIALYLLYRWWRRRRVRLALRVPQVRIAALLEELRGATAPLVFDVRSDVARHCDPRIIRGARLADARRIKRAVAGVGHAVPLVIYCSCPNEATSSRAAKRLLAAGYLDVRALNGGLPAWERAGYPVEPLPARPGPSVAQPVPRDGPGPTGEPRATPGKPRDRATVG